MHMSSQAKKLDLECLNVILTLGGNLSVITYLEEFLISGK